MQGVASQQASPPREAVVQQVLPRQELERVPPEEQTRKRQERGEQRQQEVLADAPPRQASCELPWRLLLSLPFQLRLSPRPRLPLGQHRGSVCALFRLRRLLSNWNASFSP